MVWSDKDKDSKSLRLTLNLVIDVRVVRETSSNSPFYVQAEGRMSVVVISDQEKFR